MDMQSALEKAGLWNGSTAVPKKSRNGGVPYRKERFSAEFKQRAVDRVKEVGNVKAVSEEMQIVPSTLHTWVYIVEHGGTLEPSAGWVPENGDRFYAKNPRSAPTGPNHLTVSERYPGDIVDPIIHMTQDHPAEQQSAIGSDGQGRSEGYYSGPSTVIGKCGLEQAQAGQVPQDYVRMRRLEAENEALRQIVRGFQSLLNLRL